MYDLQEYSVLGRLQSIHSSYMKAVSYRALNLKSQRYSKILWQTETALVHLPNRYPQVSPEDGVFLISTNSHPHREISQRR